MTNTNVIAFKFQKKVRSTKQTVRLKDIIIVLEQGPLPRLSMRQ